MRSIRSYHRPQSLDEALGLLDSTSLEPRLLAGGTVVNVINGGEPFDVVDLQALGLDGFDVGDGTIEVGAMTRLQDLVDNPAVPGLLRGLAHREGPNTLRNSATVGGMIGAADPESELLAGLLVHEAVVRSIGSKGSHETPLDVLLSRGGPPANAIITAVTIATGGGAAAAARTGRTPADKPIVAAVARRNSSGEVLVALTGVATTPVLVDPERIAELSPQPDFRGSADYRRRLADVLTTRVLTDLGRQA